MMLSAGLQAGEGQTSGLRTSAVRFIPAADFPAGCSWAPPEHQQGRAVPAVWRGHRIIRGPLGPAVPTSPSSPDAAKAPHSLYPERPLPLLSLVGEGLERDALSLLGSRQVRGKAGAGGAQRRIQGCALGWEQLELFPE